jgi:hypothetical protein
MRVNRSGVNVEPASAPAAGDSRHYRTRAVSKRPRGVEAHEQKLWGVPFEKVSVQAALRQNSRLSSAPKARLKAREFVLLVARSWQQSSIAGGI